MKYEVVHLKNDLIEELRNHTLYETPRSKPYQTVVHPSTLSILVMTVTPALHRLILLYISFTSLYFTEPFTPPPFLHTSFYDGQAAGTEHDPHILCHHVVLEGDGILGGHLVDSKLTHGPHLDFQCKDCYLAVLWPNSEESTTCCSIIYLMLKIYEK